MNENLARVLERHPRDRSSLIPLLQDVQDELGYLPPEAMREVARRLNVPESAVYGVVTFYAQFYLTRQGRHKVKVCLGTACHVKGASELMRHLEDTLDVKSGRTTADGRFTLEEVRCLGACALAPVITIDGDYHPKVTPRSAKRILKRYP